jgi:hypothetical protein
MRMLAVNDGLTVCGLTGLEQKWVPPARDSQRIETDHGPQHDGSAAQSVLGAQHAPIGRVHLIAAPPTALLCSDNECLSHPKEVPLADLINKHWHRPARRLKCRPGTLAHQEAASSIHGGVIHRLMPCSCGFRTGVMMLAVCGFGMGLVTGVLLIHRLWWTLLLRGLRLRLLLVVMLGGGRRRDAQSGCDECAVENLGRHYFDPFLRRRP